MKKLLILICLLPLSFFCCKDKERPTIYIDQETKDYCDFKIGSWWAYKEEITGKIDTIKVYNYESIIESIPEFSNVDYEIIIMSTIWASFGHDITKANPFIKIDADYRYGKDSKKSYVEEQYPHGVYVPFYIYYSFDSIGQKEQIHDELKFEKHYDSIELQGKRYYEVKEISTSSNAFGKKQKRIFWAKNVGRIRFETFGGEIWNLVNYHVLQ